jgi:hypothetical protein
VVPGVDEEGVLLVEDGVLRSAQGGTLVDAVTGVYCADEAQRLLRSLRRIVSEGGIKHDAFASPHPHNKNI